MSPDYILKKPGSLNLKVTLRKLVESSRKHLPQSIGQVKVLAHFTSDHTGVNIN